MKKTLRANITDLPYSLHDMHVTKLSIRNNELTFKFADGYERNIESGGSVMGEICFHDIDSDFCFAYVLDICANEGIFTGRKQFLDSFIAGNNALDFEIIDETYGYNTSKFSGWLRDGDVIKECIIEIYHLGAMEYITEEPS